MVKRRDGDPVPELGDSLRRAIAAKTLKAFRDRPELGRRLVEEGLIDPHFAGTDPAETDDPVAYIRDFGISLARRLRERPSFLARLGLSSLSLLGEDAIGTSQAIAGSSREDLTVVFTDLEGFIPFSEDQGDRAAAELLTEHYGVVKGVARARGGRVAKRLSDCHMVAFDSPMAAATASLEMVELAPEPLSLRAGAHAGEVMVSSGDLLGSVVALASRLAAAAAGGQVLVTAQVREPAGEVPGVSFRFIPPQVLAGVNDPMVLWEVGRA